MVSVVDGRGSVSEYILTAPPAKPHIWSVLQSRPNGSSGKGITYHSEVHKCARKVRLTAERKLLQLGGEEDSGEAAMVGVHYHALKEFHFTPALRDEYVIDMSDGDFAFKEACRLFEAYQAAWGSQCTWGEVLACEVPFEHGLIPGLTGRVDAIVRTPGGNIRGLNLQAGGRYAIDWKTGSQLKATDAVTYEDGLQALNYIDALNQELPADDQILGCIFDKVARHKDITAKKSFTAHLALPDRDATAILRNMVEQSEQLMAADWCGATSCTEGYRPCPFLLDKSCRRV